jgi:hypothetical protein
MLDMTVHVRASELAQRVASLSDDVPDEQRHVDVSLRLELYEHEHDPRRDRAFGDDASRRIAREVAPDDGVAHAIAELVGVTFGHRHGSEDVARVMHG